jgi:hypothetical protein
MMITVWFLFLLIVAGFLFQYFAPIGQKGTYLENIVGTMGHSIQHLGESTTVRRSGG